MPFWIIDVITESITNRAREAAYRLYLAEPLQINFILSVLTSRQNGIILTDNNKSPSCGVVLHDFGWAQKFGVENRDLDEYIEREWCVGRAFITDKVRMFSLLPDEVFGKYAPLSERLQFRFVGAKNKSSSHGNEHIKILPIQVSNLKDINQVLGLDLCQRNWPSLDSFTWGSFGFVALVGDKIAAAVYSCAGHRSNVEIDIYTKDEFRGRGIAYRLCTKFINECMSRGLVPCWDCYSNNLGSIRLAESVGFEVDSTYTHYVLSKS